MTSCKGPNTISLIGLDESGKEVDIGVDRTIYQNALTNYVQEMNFATVNALEATNDAKWALTKVDVGLSASASLNIGPVWKLGYSAGQRVIFTKN
jgi:hypothetical protein